MELPFKAHHFRAARAMRSGYSAAVSTNHPTHQLWNSASGDALLVVRHASLVSTAATTGILVLATQTQFGTPLGVVAPLVGLGQVGPGQHYYLDSATAITPDFVLNFNVNAAYWTHEFPIAVLQPGWGLVLQLTTTATASYACFMWEFLDPIDFYAGDIAVE